MMNAKIPFDTTNNNLAPELSLLSNPFDTLLYKVIKMKIISLDF